MEGLKNDDDVYIPLSENITISIKSSDEFVSTESDPESESFYLSYEEELPDQNRDNFYGNIGKMKNFQNFQNSLGIQRESTNVSNSLQSQYFPNSIINLSNEENIKNINTYSELNYGYDELSKIMSKYTFFDAAKIILKINNGILEDNPDYHELYQKLKSISSVIKNKNNLTLMCLGILSSKVQLKKEEEKENKIRKENIQNKNENAKKDKIENKEISKFIERIKRKCKKKYIFRNHYYKVNNRIYCYKSKSLEPRHYATLFCEKRDINGCNAKILVTGSPKDILVLGVHKHGGTSKLNFYNSFPKFKGKNWNHIQIFRKIKGMHEDYIYSN